MKRENLYNSFDSIVPDNEQRSRMLNEILDKKEDLNNMKYRRPKFIIIAATICLMTTTVIATNIPAFQNLLEKISPNMAEFIEPIEEVSISEGIKMEVVAAARYDNMVKAYITFQDLEGNRIDENLSFLDYYTIEGANNCGWGLIDYDEEEKKATILVEAQNNTKFKGENLTFKVENIFYDNKEYEDYEIGIDLSEISHNPSFINATTRQFMSWSHGKLYGGLNSDDEIVPILSPHDVDFKFPDIHTSMISNIGVIDGKLHVQVWRDTNFEGQGVQIYLRDSKGEKITGDTHINFRIDELKKLERSPHHTYYSEYIFDIDTDNLNEYKLLGYFDTSKQLKGNWQVSFKAEDGEILEKTCNIDLGDVTIEKISINPFGIFLRVEGTDGVDISNHLSDIDIKLNSRNDVIRDTKSNIAWSSTSLLGEEGNSFLSSYDIEKPIDLNLIESITINGETILIK